MKLRRAVGAAGGAEKAAAAAAAAPLAPAGAVVRAAPAPAAGGAAAAAQQPAAASGSDAEQAQREGWAAVGAGGVRRAAAAAAAGLVERAAAAAAAGLGTLPLPQRPRQDAGANGGGSGSIGGEGRAAPPVSPGARAKTAAGDAGDATPSHMAQAAGGAGASHSAGGASQSGVAPRKTVLASYRMPGEPIAASDFTKGAGVMAIGARGELEVGANVVFFLEGYLAGALEDERLSLSDHLTEEQSAPLEAYELCTVESVAYGRESNPSEAARSGLSALIALKRQRNGAIFAVDYVPDINCPNYLVLASEYAEGMRAGWATGDRAAMYFPDEEQPLTHGDWYGGVVTAVSAERMASNGWEAITVEFDENPGQSQRVSSWELRRERRVAVQERRSAAAADNGRQQASGASRKRAASKGGAGSAYDSGGDRSDDDRGVQKKRARGAAPKSAGAAAAAATGAPTKKAYSYNRVNDCAICGGSLEGRAMLQCQLCKRPFHLECADSDQPIPTPGTDAAKDFLCTDCVQKDNCCFYCGKPALPGNDLLPCGKGNVCPKRYHLSCAKEMRLTRWRLGTRKTVSTANNHAGSTTFVCPSHFCDLCEMSGDSLRLLRCITCVKSYHVSCVPDGVRRFADDRTLECLSCQGVFDAFEPGRDYGSVQRYEDVARTKVAGEPVRLLGKRAVHFGKRWAQNLDFVVEGLPLKLHSRVVVRVEAGKVPEVVAEMCMKKATKSRFAAVPTRVNGRVLEHGPGIVLAGGDDIDIGPGGCFRYFAPPASEATRPAPSAPTAPPPKQRHALARRPAPAAAQKPLPAAPKAIPRAPARPSRAAAAPVKEEEEDDGRAGEDWGNYRKALLAKASRGGAPSVHRSWEPPSLRIAHADQPALAPNGAAARPSQAEPSARAAARPSQAEPSASQSPQLRAGDYGWARGQNLPTGERWWPCVVDSVAGRGGARVFVRVMGKEGAGTRLADEVLPLDWPGSRRLIEQGIQESGAFSRALYEVVAAQSAQTQARCFVAALACLGADGAKSRES